jgi:hypothetical protein
VDVCLSRKLPLTERPLLAVDKQCPSHKAEALLNSQHYQPKKGRGNKAANEAESYFTLVIRYAILAYHEEERKIYGLLVARDH